MTPCIARGLPSAKLRTYQAKNLPIEFRGCGNLFLPCNRLRYTRWQEENTPIPELVKLATFRRHQSNCLSEKFLDCTSELA
jgi:hypothetical protein